MYYLISFTAAALIFWICKHRALYFLFFAAYIHNLAVAFLYTHGFVGKDLARALILFKDFLLFVLFVWCLQALVKHFRTPWPRPFKALLFFTAYCIFRFAFGFLFLGDKLGEGLYRLKIICFPFEVLVVITVLTALHAKFGMRFLREMTYVLAVLAVVAIGILVLAPRDFWVKNANIAELQADIKGDTENELDFDQGLSLGGTMRGRELLAVFFSYRAVGTFGEALALSFTMTVPVLLLYFYFPKNIVSVLCLVAVSAALFLALARSAWIFCFLIGTYVLVRQRRFRPFLAVGGLLLAFALVWPPIVDFAAASVLNLSPSAQNPDSEHAEGILWFYSKAFSDLNNIGGKGMSPEAQTIPESGYAYLLERFGLLAYASFLWFCFSLFRLLRSVKRQPPVVAFIAQGISLGILVIMHFSQYPFSLPTFMSLWFVVGLCLSEFLLHKNDRDTSLSLATRAVPGVRLA